MSKRIFIFLRIMGLPLVPILFFQPAIAHEGQYQGSDGWMKPISGDSIYNLKSPWISLEGENVTLSSLRGHPVVAAMGYTSCESACPVIVEDMKKVEMGLPEKGKSSVIFAFFSFDSARDTPERLKKFAANHRVDLKHWRFFQGPPKSVRKLAAVLGVSYKKDSEGKFDHSNLISLIDSNGIVKYQAVGLQQDFKELQVKLLELISN